MIANAIESKLDESGGTSVPQGTVPLPPSERDFELYNLVVIEGASTRAAAGVFGLSQTRVIQIRNRVAEWIASEVPPLASATPAQRLALAADIARNRIDFMYSQAMDAWRASQGQSTTARSSHGDPRYLMLAARITERSIGVETRIVKASEVAQNVTSAASEQPAGHPVGDCSPPAVSARESADVKQEAAVVSAQGTEVSEQNRQRRRDFLRGLGEVDDPCSASTSNSGPGSRQRPAVRAAS